MHVRQPHVQVLQNRRDSPATSSPVAVHLEQLHRLGIEWQFHLKRTKYDREGGVWVRTTVDILYLLNHEWYRRKLRGGVFSGVLICLPYHTRMTFITLHTGRMLRERFTYLLLGRRHTLGVADYRHMFLTSRAF